MADQDLIQTVEERQAMTRYAAQKGLIENPKKIVSAEDSVVLQSRFALEKVGNNGLAVTETMINNPTAVLKIAIALGQIDPEKFAALGEKEQAAALKEIQNVFKKKGVDKMNEEIVAALKSSDLRLEARDLLNESLMIGLGFSKDGKLTAELVSKLAPSRSGRIQAGIELASGASDKVLKDLSAGSGEERRSSGGSSGGGASGALAETNNVMANVAKGVKTAKSIMETAKGIMDMFKS